MTNSVTKEICEVPAFCQRGVRAADCDQINLIASCVEVLPKLRQIDCRDLKPGSAVTQGECAFGGMSAHVQHGGGRGRAKGGAQPFEIVRRW